jgi:hypothetical protein
MRQARRSLRACVTTGFRKQVQKPIDLNLKQQVTTVDASDVIADGIGQISIARASGQRLKRFRRKDLRKRFLSEVLTECLANLGLSKNSKKLGDSLQIENPATFGFTLVVAIQKMYRVPKF